jgi:hypothetical protein
MIEYTVYPEEMDYIVSTETYITENYTEYFENISNTRWNTYYNKNIAGPVNFN